MAVTYPGAGTFPGLALYPNSSDTVAPPTSTGIVTLAEVKAFLDPSLFGTSDLELQLFIDAITPLIEEHVGPVLPRTVIETVRGPVLRSSRVASVLTVTYAGQPVTYDANLDSGLLYNAPLGSTVTYTAGFTAIPAAIKLAALYAVQHAAESQRGAVPVPFQSGADESFVTSRGFALPNRAKELLAPFRRGQRVA